jgi:hypothetical protein
MRQIMAAIYAIRRRLIEIRQAFIGIQLQAEQIMVPVTPTMERDYPRFLDGLTKKAMLLLHIQAVLSLKSFEFDQCFLKILHHGQMFFQSLVIMRLRMIPGPRSRL